jgi:Tfp pilus assembly protein PilF
MNVLGNVKTTLKRLGLIAGFFVAGCRGREPAQGQPSDAIITARTLGLAYLRDGQLARAESAFQKVIDMAPGQALGYANLGLVHLRQGRYQDAEREIRKAAGLDTASDDIALMLATVYRHLGIDTHRTFTDFSGRPIPILEHGQPIPELI